MTALALSLVLCLLQLAAHVHAGGTYSHTIPYGKEECMLIRVPKDQVHIVSASFDCLDTKIATDPIRVALYNASEKKIWSSDYGDAEGSFHERGTGKHWLCLENGLTYEQKKKEAGETVPPRNKVTRTIGFSLRVKKSATGAVAEALKAGAGGVENVEDTTQRLMELVEDLNDNFEDLEDHMTYMKMREGVHRTLHEETFSKVVLWNILEIIAVVVVTFGQVLNVWWILSKRRNSYY